MNDLQIFKERDLLIIKKSNTSHLLKFLFYFVFIFVWYATLLNENSNNFQGNNYLIVVFYFAPLFGIFDIIRSVKVLFGKEVYYLNKATKEILRDQKVIGYFDEVENIQIRTLYDSDSGNDYRLSIVFKNQNKVRIDQLKNFESISDIADALADYLDVTIIKK